MKPIAQITLVVAFMLALPAFAQDPLPSWNDTAPKKAIVAFVEKVTKQGSPDFVPVPERIATVDNDGTLWAEQPMYFQLRFALDRVKALAPQHPEWKTKPPFSKLLSTPKEENVAVSEHELMEIIMAAHAGMTTEEFEKIVKDWIATAKHPKTGKLYTERVYQPMLELLAYLRANGFKTFIVSGGGIEFMRPWTEKVYGIPPEQVIGSSGKTKFEMRDGKPVLMKLPEINFIDDKAGKPVGIQQHIGRRPIAAFGLQTAVIPSVSTYGLDTTEWLMPQCLKEAGYKTAIIGKWHLGHADKKHWPKQRGFDYQYGAMIGELDYFTHEEHHVLDWYRDNKPVREKGYTTQLIGNDAVKLIEKHDAAAPLYLYLTFNAPHTPYQAPKEYIDRYKNIEDPTRRTYAGMVACLDDEIGRVVAALDKKGIRDNTLILFHSDNGGTRNAMFVGVMADMSKVKLPCDNGPYREGKASLYEGGTRVCALANWPGRIKAQTVDGLIHAVDIYPTLAALAGASTAKCKPLDGVDAWATIAEGKPSPRTEIIYNIEPFRGAVRQGDWKLIWRTLLSSSVDLYNLAQDPSEKNNLAAQHPEKVAAFQRRLEALAKESAKPLFLADQFKVIMKNANGEPVLPTDERFGEAETH